MTPPIIPPGQALVTYTRVAGSSMRTTTRSSRGRRCSIRSYDMTVLPMPGVTLADRPRSYAYADGEMSYALAKVARRGSFTAVIAHPHANRARIMRIIDENEAALAARKARMQAEDAAWDAAGPAAS